MKNKIRLLADQKIKLILIVSILLFLGGGVSVAYLSHTTIEQFNKLTKSTIQQSNNTASVLAAGTLDPHFIFTVNVESFFRENAQFNKNVDIKGTLTASNLIQAISAGNGITVSGTGQNPIIANTGVLSIQGQTGAVTLSGAGIKIEGTKLTNTGVLSFQGQSGTVTLTNGSGINISDTTISNNGVLSLQSQTGALSLTAGTGIAINGLTITNQDPGSSQNIFKTINVGNTIFSASGNTDILTLASGSGVTITSDTTNKLLTISSTGTSSQWATNGTSIYYNTGAVGIGATNPLAALDVRGNSGTQPTTSISGATSFASLVVDNSGTGDLFTASSSGLSRFTIAQNGNIGIGTTPTSNGLLALNGNQYFTGNYKIYFDNTPNLYIGAGKNNDLTLATNQNNWLRIGSGGGVSFWGSGNPDANDTPDVRLDINGRLGIGTAGNNALASLDVKGNSGTLPIASISGATSFASLVVDNSGTGDLFTASSSGLNRFVITQNGNVGIGTTTLNEMLGVSGGNIILDNNYYYKQYNLAGTGKNILGLDSSNNLRLINQDGTLFINPDFNTATSLNFNSNNNIDMVAGTSNGSVGIGTTSPLARLDVRGISGTLPVASISGATSFAGLLVDNSGTGDLFTASSSGLNRFVITQNGNVGIGTTTPTASLHISNPNASNIATFNNSLNSRTTTITAWGDIALDPAATLYTSSITGLNGNPLYINPGGLNTYINSLNGGFVGIGTSSPFGTLDVRTNSGTLPIASISGQTSFAGLVVDNSGTGDLFTASSSGLNRFVITQNGNVGIGTNLPSYPLSVVGNIADVSYAGANAVLYAAPTTGLFTNTTTTTQNQCLLSGNGVNGTPSWGGCALGTNYWQINSGILAPTTISNTLSIGTTASLGTLDVRNLNGTQPTASISGATSFAGLLVDNSGTGDLFTASSSGLNRFVITQNGNVGINNTLPLTTLDVTGSASISANLSLRGTAIAHTLNILDNGTLNIQRSTNGDAGLTPVIYVDPTGSVGIGTTNVGQLLTVTGSFFAGGSTGLDISDSTITGAVAPGYAGTGEYPVTINAPGGSLTYIDLQTANTSRLIIDASGKVGIGTTSPGTLLQLGTAGTKQGVLSLAGGASGLVTISTQADAGTWTMTLPNSAGTNGYVLTTNGSGGLSWTANGGGYWQLNSGILAPLTLTNKLSIGVPTNTTSFGTLDIRALNGTQPTASISGATSFAGLLVDNSGTGDLFTASSSGLNRFVIAKNGNVGIGTTLPNSTLDVRGDTEIVAGDTDWGQGLRILSGSDTKYGNLFWGYDRSNIEWALGRVNSTINGAANNDLVLSNKDWTGSSLNIAGAQGMQIYFDKSNGNTLFGGNVGIGTTDPAARMQIGNNSDNTSSFFSADDFTTGANGIAMFVGNANWNAPNGCWGIGQGTAGNDTTLRMGMTNFSGSSCTNTWSNTQNLNIIVNGALGQSALAALDLRASSGTTAVASISGQTSFASLVVDNSGVGDLFTASSSGLNRFVIAQNGNIGIGTNIPTALLNTEQTRTDTSGFLYMNLAQSYANPNSNSSATYITSYNRAFTNSGVSSDITGAIIGLYNETIHQGSGSTNAYGSQTNVKLTSNGTIASGIGALFSTQVEGTGTITSAFGAYVNNPTINGGGSIQNTVGLAVENLTTAANNTELLLGTGNVPAGNYGIYNAATYDNYFAGKLAIGATSPLATLDTRALSGTLPVASISGKTSFAGLVVDNSGVGDLFTASSSGLNRFVIKQNGNVGIGTTNPGATLDLANGTIQGAGLSSDCSGTGDKLLWNSTTKQFSCGTDRASVTIMKTADEAISNSTTLQPDDALTFPIGANDEYTFRMTLHIYGSGALAGNLKYQIDAPSGASCFLTDVSVAADINTNLKTSTINSDCGTITSWNNTTTIGGTIEIWGSIINGANAGNVTLNWTQNTSNSNATTIKAGSNLFAFKATGADYAETYYTNDHTMQPGDIVSIDKTLKAGVKKSQTSYDNTTLGIVSTQPGTIIGDTGLDGMPVPVALAGRVPLKVSTTNGPITGGDYLTSSSIPGVAMKATKQGEMIGKAMEDFTGSDSQSTGVIMAFVHLSWADPTITITDSGQLIADSLIDTSNNTEIAQTVSSNTTSSQLLQPENISNNTQNITKNITQLQSQIASLSAQFDLFKNNLENQFISSASLSANLSQLLAPRSLGEVGSTSDASFSGTLSVLGHTLLSDVGITGKLNIGLLTIDGLGEDQSGSQSATINTLSGPLKLQSLGLEGIDLFNGKVTIDTSGNIKTINSIQAKKYNIDTTDVSAASAGIGTVNAGEKTITIRTTIVTEKSLIYVTFKDDYKPALRYWIDNKIIDKSFTLKLDSPVENNSEFNWWIVN